jgi:hypothetical protein
MAGDVRRMQRLGVSLPKDRRGAGVDEKTVRKALSRQAS